MTARRGLATLVALGMTLAGARSIKGQTLHLGGAAARSTYNEVGADARQSGFGAAGSAVFAMDRWAVEGEVNWRTLAPDVDENRESITLAGASFRARYAVWRELDAEVGVDSRTMSPEFSGQDAAVLLVGLRYESSVSSRASYWIRGAAIPLSRFNGGGSGGVGMALGFGLSISRPGASWRGFAAYDFQRLDRTVGGNDVPIQYEGVRVGVEFAVLGR